MSSPVGRAADGIGEDVAIDVAGEREGDDQRRRGQEAGLELRMDASREVAVARQNGDGKDAALRHGLARSTAGSGPELPMQVVQP